MNLTFMMIVSFLFGALAAYLSHKQGKNPYLWFTVGFLFGLMGVFALLIPFKKKKSPPKKRVVPAPQPYIDGPKNCAWYYVDGEQQQKGPMSLHALSTAWKKGEIASSTFVWHEELSEWKALGEFIRKRSTSSL